jgi:hypothetical protein
MNYDTVLPERILRRYRRPRFRVPRWIKRSLAIGAFTLSGLALICLLALIKPPTLRERQAHQRDLEIIHQAIYGASPTPPPVRPSPTKAPRATLIKLPDNWNNVCTP